jgi:hypothetical protein
MTSTMLSRGYWSHNCSVVVVLLEGLIVVYARFFVLVHGPFGHLIPLRRDWYRNNSVEARSRGSQLALGQT